MSPVFSIEVALEVLCGRVKQRGPYLVTLLRATSNVAAFCASNPYRYLSREPLSERICRLKLPTKKTTLVLERWPQYEDGEYSGYVDAVGYLGLYEFCGPVYHAHNGCGMHVNTAEDQRITWYADGYWSAPPRVWFLRSRFYKGASLFRTRVRKNMAF